MIVETIILAGLAKLGCIVTAVKITKWKKQAGEVVKKEKSPRVKHKKTFTGVARKYREDKCAGRDKIKKLNKSN